MNLAHGVGSVYETELPLALYLAGAAATVIVSFVVRAFAKPTPADRSERVVAGDVASETIVAVLKAVAFVVFILLFVFAIAQPEAGLSVTPLLFWVGVIVTTAILQSIVGGLWERANPWVTIGNFLQASRGRESRPAPLWLGPLMLFALFWFELVSGEGFDPLAIAIVLLGYTLFVLSAGRAFADDWGFVDPLSILFGFAGRLAPFEVTDEGIVHKGMLRDLDRAEPMPWPWFASVFVLLGATTFDNLRETVGWEVFMETSGLGSLPEIAVETVALLVVLLPFLIPFLVAMWIARRWWTTGTSFVDDSRRLAWSLIPIGIAYLLAHNMPLLITGLPQLISQIGAEFGLDLFGRYIPSPKLVWFLEIALIVGGHVLGVLAAHRAALRLAPSHGAAVKSHTVLTILMSGFTIVTLYLLSLPLVVMGP